MECQTCSKTFPTRDALHEHIGVYQVRTLQARQQQSNRFQSRAQYLVRELLKCLAHASSSNEEGTSDLKEDSNIGDDSDDNLVETLEEEQSDLDDDLQCPQQI